MESQNFAPQRHQITASSPIQSALESVSNHAQDAVCAKLELSTAAVDQVTELVARRIIELARTGERDANRLVACVLAEFGVGNDGSLWQH